MCCFFFFFSCSSQLLLLFNQLKTEILHSHIMEKTFVLIQELQTAAEKSFNLKKYFWKVCCPSIVYKQSTNHVCTISVIAYHASNWMTLIFVFYTERILAHWWSRAMVCESIDDRNYITCHAWFSKKLRGKLKINVIVKKQIDHNFPCSMLLQTIEMTWWKCSKLCSETTRRSQVLNLLWRHFNGL